MTDTQYDRAPGDASALPDVEQGTSSGVLVYTIGLGLAMVLTAMSFWVANTSLLWGPGVPLGLAVLAIAQMGVHLVFFLHITTGPDNTNNVLALAYGILIIFLVIASTTSPKAKAFCSSAIRAWNTTCSKRSPSSSRRSSRSPRAIASATS